MQPLGEDETKALVTGVGAALRDARIVTGWSIRRLARATGCAPSTVYRLEHGQRRPRPCLLRVMASVLAVDDPKPLAERLIEAAGQSLAPDTPGAVRRRTRRANAALLAGHKPLPTDLARSLALHRKADAQWRMAMAMLVPASFDDLAVLDRAASLLEQKRRLRDAAGDPVTLVVGNRVIRAGWLP